MPYKLMSLPTIQLARLLGLVRRVEAVRLEPADRPSWAVLVDGRGFTRLLRDDVLIAPTLIRPLSAYRPHPRVFFSLGSARQFIADTGLGSSDRASLRTSR